jgi:hydrogenase expression/formation protein HypE
MTVAPELNLDGWTCPMPLRDYPNVLMGHGGGGKLSAELIDYLFSPEFSNNALDQRGDGAVMPMRAGRIAISTDSFVVNPLFFPGGTIGDLAINGTVNDLAMMGAQPLALTAGFILEEGLSLATLGSIAQRMGLAARTAGVQIVTGDTKVVEKGHGDGVFINTSGIGYIPDGVDLRPDRAQPGDVVIISGTLGDHGMAILSVRQGLAFETIIESDCAPLNGMVAALLAAAPDTHVLRDPTRGGLASSLNEIAASAHVGIALIEKSLPVNPATAAACELLGMDPVYVANEGKLVAIVARDQADAALAALRAHPFGRNAAIIGEVVSTTPGRVTARTPFGSTRIIDMQIGEQLPRIC